MPVHHELVRGLPPQMQFLSYCYAIAPLLVKRPTTLQTGKAITEIQLALRDLSILCAYLPSFHHSIEWRPNMAKNTPSFNLIEYRLTDHELEAFDEWVAKTHPSISTVLTALAEKDYKMSFSFIENSNSWCVSVTGKEDAKFNAKSTLTTWSEDPLEGAVMALYKVLVIFGGGVWKTRTESRRG